MQENATVRIRLYIESEALLCSWVSLALKMNICVQPLRWPVICVLLCFCVAGLS